MKKNLIWGLAAILACGLTFTSCEKSGGNSELLLGNWFMTEESESYGDKMITYALLSFGEDGVLTEHTYLIYPDEPANHSERILRHAIYTSDDTAGTITTDDGEEVQTVRYQLSGSELSLSTLEAGVVAVLHRPTAAELEKVGAYDFFISSNDYIGRWFFTKEIGNLTLYGMLKFDENGKLESVRYALSGETRCIRTKSTMLYNEYDDDLEERVIEIHDPTDYFSSTFYHWTIVDDHLKLENMDDEDNVLDCHPLSPADLELMAKLDKLVK